MQFKIGFALSEEKKEETTAPASAPVVPDERLPRRSVVRVHFPQRNMTLAYYNDRFDLHRGDLVYVDGKLEGMRGRVVDVNYNFRIDLADYKRVIAVADTLQIPVKFVGVGEQAEDLMPFVAEDFVEALIS